MHEPVMVRPQIQLPAELYKRAKALAAARELSLAELTRRGLELFLDRFPANNVSTTDESGGQARR